MGLIYKIVAFCEWENGGQIYAGSKRDQLDGFLHFSTATQLSQTLRRYYLDKNNLVLVAVDEDLLGPALKWEYSNARGEKFPHLFGALNRAQAKWVRPIGKDADGHFLLPELT